MINYEKLKLLVISLILAAIFSYSELPINALPGVEDLIINVRVGHPEMDSQMVAANIALPLEKEFMQMSDIDQVTSACLL
jgi:multidrug efflux pump subunit AcrB